jgi:uncharacterized protein (TIGR00255 family)
MSIASMTGFARVQGHHGDVRWAWELRSVNGRNLDLKLRLPFGSEALEPALREAATKRLARGNVQATLTVDRPRRPPEIRIDTAVLAALAAAASDAARLHGLAPPTADGLLSVKGVVDLVEPVESEEAQAGLSSALAAGYAEALDALCRARADEGVRLAGVLEGHLAAITALTAAARSHPSRQPEAIRTRLADQIAALLDASSALDPQRLAQEAALVATRIDVREEVDRLNAHVAHARRLIAEGGAAGRKLDFLAQEFNREANTLCSKANDREVTEIGLSLKTVIDQLREQVQNVE